MEQEFVPYAKALKLKQLGFKYPCFGRYYNEEFELDYGAWNSLDVEHIIAAPLFQQAFRWFREEHNLSFSIRFTQFGQYWIQYASDERYGDKHDTYEEAELACLDKLIEIVKNKQQEQ